MKWSVNSDHFNNILIIQKYLISYTTVLLSEQIIQSTIISIKTHVKPFGNRY